MTKILSSLVAVLSCAFGAWLALALVSFVVLRFSSTVAPTILLGCRIGGVAGLLPSFWVAIFLGTPLGGGLFIGVFGESAMNIGLVFGFAGSFFVGVLLCAVIGALLAVIFHWTQRTRDVA